MIFAMWGRGGAARERSERGSFANLCERERGMLGKNVCYWGSEAHANELAARAKPEATGSAADGRKDKIMRNID